MDKRRSIDNRYWKQLCQLSVRCSPIENCQPAELSHLRQRLFRSPPFVRGITINAPLREIGNRFDPGDFRRPMARTTKFPRASRILHSICRERYPASLSFSRGCTRCQQTSGSHVGGKSYLHEGFSSSPQVDFDDLQCSMTLFVVSSRKLRRFISRRHFKSSRALLCM